MKFICQICESPFNKAPSVRVKGFAKFCSRKCEVEGRPNKPVDRICVQCGISFKKDYWSVHILGNGGKFCSRSCTDKFKRKLRKRNEQNLFTNWQKKEWLKSFCEKCNSTQNLELDHKTPRFAGGLATKENAQTLCRTCNRTKFWTDDYHMYTQLLNQRVIES
jgi:hypothetical protein